MKARIRFYWSFRWRTWDGLSVTEMMDRRWIVGIGRSRALSDAIAARRQKQWAGWIYPSLRLEYYHAHWGTWAPFPCRCRLIR